MTLPDAFLARPIAHRALHDITAGRAENSHKAVQAAIDAGYGIEIDVQLSSDGQAMAFHDDALDRLTNATGPLRAHNAASLSAIPLKHDGDTIPTLPEILRRVAGRVPLLIEIKDQDGQLGPNIGQLEQATADALSGYDGPVAVMSFNPHAIIAMAALAPDIPRGLTTDPFTATDWPDVPQDRRTQLAQITDFTAAKACFISHNASDLSAAPVKQLWENGFPVLCWTIKSPKAEAAARKLADNITFEGYQA